MFNKCCFIIDNPIYRLDLIVFVNLEDSAVKETLKERLESDIWPEIENFVETEGRAVTFKFSNDRMAIKFNELTKKNYCGLLAHECFHVTEMVMDVIGVKHCMDRSGEAFAYLLHFYVDQINEQIHKVVQEEEI